MTYKPKERNGFMFFHDEAETLLELETTEQGEMISAMLTYSMTGKLPSFEDRALRIIWKQMQNMIDRDIESYDKKVLDSKVKGLTSAYSKLVKTSETSELDKLKFVKEHLTDEEWERYTTVNRGQPWLTTVNRGKLNANANATATADAKADADADADADAIPNPTFSSTVSVEEKVGGVGEEKGTSRKPTRAEVTAYFNTACLYNDSYGIDSFFREGQANAWKDANGKKLDWKKSANDYALAHR